MPLHFVTRTSGSTPNGLSQLAPGSFIGSTVYCLLPSVVTLFDQEEQPSLPHRVGLMTASVPSAAGAQMPSRSTFTSTRHYFRHRRCLDTSHFSTPPASLPPPLLIPFIIPFVSCGFSACIPALMSCVRDPRVQSGYLFGPPQVSHFSEV
jgi:hypothetical protein